MRTKFVFVVLIAVILALKCINSSNTANNQTPLTKNIGKMVCNVNLVQDSHVSEAIKTLETKLENLTTQNSETNFKLENLIALLNKTSTPQPTLPAVAVSSCKEQLGKHTEAIKNLETKLENLIALVNKTSTPQPTPQALFAVSCKEQYEKFKSSKSQVYTLMFSSQKIPVYCHMGNFGCGDGGWTPAMKIDGTKKTFHYSSHFWSNKNVYNLAGGKTGFDTQETKLPSYWNTPFSKICLSMKIGRQIKFIVITKHANSLYSLIADGKYRSTSLGRNTWKTLIGSQASLEYNCNKEGFNAEGSDKRASKARIGFLGNNENNCVTPDSRIGFGTGGYHDDFNTCGNEAVAADNGNKHIKAFGYILVQ